MIRTQPSESGRAVTDASDGEERYLATRAAWLYYNTGLKQSEVAASLGVSLNKANRLLASAQEHGVVRVTVEGPIACCVGLEDELRHRFDLGTVRVVPEASGPAACVDAVGRATSSVLVHAVRSGRHRLLGIGRGPVVSAMASFVPILPRSRVEFVSLFGCPPVADCPLRLDPVRVLGERSGNRAYLMPAPIYARTAADLAVLTRQPGVQAALDAARRSTFLLSDIADIGDATDELVRCGVLREAEIVQARVAGAVSIFLGHFLDRDGRPVATSVNRRIVGLPLAAVAQRETIGVAVGEHRAGAILSVLHAGLLSGLVTTERVGRQLLDAG